jgi:alpha-L-fucosidase
MTTTFTRRQFATLTAAAAALLRLPRLVPQNAPPPHQIAPGPFKPTWESLTANYKTPEWFRDAKFGMWAHWTTQCVPEQGWSIEN